MKKTYIIILGVTAVLILLSVWVYLLIYGTPKPVENFFTDFSFAGNRTAENPIPVMPEPIATIDIETTQLRQLTTKPVIGFKEIINQSDNTQEVYYAEAGTGHVYAINLVTGAERRISNTTIAKAEQASFRADGNYVAVRAGSINSPVTLINISNPETITTEVLATKIIDYTFANQNELLYTKYQGNGQIGQSLNPETGTVRNLFTVPFTSAIVAWGLDSSTPNYVYPKASAKLAGYLYSLRGGTIKRENAAGAGLTAMANANYFITTTLFNDKPRSFATDITTKERTALTVVVDPNKCVFSAINLNIIYCGSQSDNFGSDFPDNWYRGEVTFSDYIYEINIKKEQSAQLINPVKIVGRSLDIINMTISAKGTVLYFTNKNDNTLWMYEI